MPWWFGAYYPNKYLLGNDDHYGYGGLYSSNTAGNSTRDNYNTLATFYDPINYGWDRPDNLALPPDLIGSVHADNTDTLKAYFVWTGDPAHVPKYANFMLQTNVSASASVSYGNAGATSGVSATATATLEQDTVTAKAGDAGSASPPAVHGQHYLHLKPNGKIATLSKTASVITDTTNGLPWATWVDSGVGSGGSGPGTYYYNGDPYNQQTSADAYANVLATAHVTAPAHPINFRLRLRPDGTPDVDILDGGRLTFHYIWDSSTNNLSNLDQNNCMVYENVTYAGNSTGSIMNHPFTNNLYYYPPDPFMNPLPEPTQLGVPGSDGACADDQLYGSGDKNTDFSTPYKAASFFGTQTFFYHSDDLAPGEFPVLLGPLTITRRVYQGVNPDDWFYDVSKSGYSSTLSLSF